MWDYSWDFTWVLISLSSNGNSLPFALICIEIFKNWQKIHICLIRLDIWASGLWKLQSWSSELWFTLFSAMQSFLPFNSLHYFSSARPSGNASFGKFSLFPLWALMSELQQAYFLLQIDLFMVLDQTRNFKA